MDDSWRMVIGMAEHRKSRKTLPRRRSTEDALTLPQQTSGIFLGPEDFNDVFGGPPRTVLSRQFLATSSNATFEEIFRPPRRISRERNQGFYSDVYSKNSSSSKSFSKSKSNASSVLSSEEFSPHRRMAAGDSSDASFSAFASNLRPINIPNRWSSSAALNDEQQWQQGPDFSTNDSSYLDSLFTESNFIDNFRSSLEGISQRCSSPETDNLDSTPYKMPIYKQELNVDVEDMQRRDKIDEVISSYVTEIGRDKTAKQVEGVEDIDEAIAWAKGKFCSKKIWGKYQEN